ncbi:MAG: mechanosensitive ion channel family protein [Myxococcota bacterium]|nr:mechanosensitive ion channel family protein [Myxococcota bacterium]
MEAVLQNAVAAAERLWPLLAVVAFAAITLTSADWLLLRRASADRRPSARLGAQLTMLGLTTVALLGIVLVLPVSENTRGQILSLLGLLLTAIIALSSTTFVSNAMAGLMSRAVGAFRPGDFVHVAEHFGRVTVRGLFHTEIQTEDGDLTELPNLFLVSHPVTVVRSTGTIISATISLGYDVSHAKVETLLLEAARAEELEEPFVRVLELGDFSVQYRVAGFLRDVKQLLTTRSNLRRCMMDALHEAGVEIVSPNFMNQRQLEPTQHFIPEQPAGEAPTAPDESPVEERIFDKAEQAGRVEALRAESERLIAEAKAAEDEARDSASNVRRSLRAQAERRRAEADALAAELAAPEAPPESEARTEGAKPGN